jgi:catechol 2,3-dioxygenase-like lactoylglutathione lyase family enzyme
MPQCVIRGVRSVELVATNFDEAAKFYEGVWGLRPVESGEGRRLFRGSSAYHHILGLHRGAQPALIRIVFDVTDRQGVDALHRAVVASGCANVGAPGQLSTAGGGYGFGCKDPTAATSLS